MLEFAKFYKKIMDTLKEQYISSSISSDDKKMIIQSIRDRKLSRRDTIKALCKLNPSDMMSITEKLDDYSLQYLTGVDKRRTDMISLLRNFINKYRESLHSSNNKSPMQDDIIRKPIDRVAKRVTENVIKEYRVSKHQLSNMSLKEAYLESYEIFKDLGFTTASTFAIWDYIYRNLPNSIKTPEIQEQKKKHYGAYLRPFVVKLINSNIKHIDVDKLKSVMLDRDMIKSYLDRNDYGHRRQGLLKKLSNDSKRSIERDY